MTRNVKRFLAGSLLSLTPSIAFAGQIELDFPDFLTQRSEYVSLREGAVQVPVRKGPSVEAIGPAVEDFFVSNQAGVDLHLGIQILTGSFNGTWNTHPVPPAPMVGFRSAPPPPPQRLSSSTTTRSTRRTRLARRPVSGAWKSRTTPAPATRRSSSEPMAAPPAPSTRPSRSSTR